MTQMGGLNRVEHGHQEVIPKSSDPTLGINDQWGAPGGEPLGPLGWMGKQGHFLPVMLDQLINPVKVCIW